jgi:hypothetical protein
MRTRESAGDHPRDPLIDRRTLLAGTGAVLLVRPRAAEAQQTKDVCEGGRGGWCRERTFRQLGLYEAYAP